MPEKWLPAAQICLPIIEELIASSVATVGKHHSANIKIWMHNYAII